MTVFEDPGTGRYRDWLRQAENDLQWAEHSLSGGFYAQTCYIAQQVSEKALKALCFAKGFDIVKTHSLFQISKALGENGELQQLAKELDLYYISGRYPDAFPAGSPCEMFSESQGVRALQGARRILALCTSRIEHGNPK